MSSRQLLIGLSLMACSMLAAVEEQTPLHGCAPALHPGQWVDIRDESALIVWDSTAKTEHFIRRASFETQSEDFGFLVPTPAQPDLGEVDGRVFASAGQLTAPRHVYEREIQTVFGFGDLWEFFEKHAPKSSPAGMVNDEARPKVEVLEQKEVAGFDAAVLRADDAQALAEWLDKHGYESRPALTRWLKWYVDHRWVITAFKITKSGRETVEAKSLRMSFQTDKPFYPYREPDDMRNPSGQGTRTLRVFFLSDQRYEGTLGEDGNWPATAVWANDIQGRVHNITSHLKLEDSDLVKTLQNARYLTEFEDRSFPRPGTDEVYFRPASDQSTQERPPIVHKTIVIHYWPGPWGTAALAGLVLGLAGYGGFRFRCRTATH